MQCKLMIITIITMNNLTVPNILYIIILAIKYRLYEEASMECRGKSSRQLFLKGHLQGPTHKILNNIHVNCRQHNCR